MANIVERSKQITGEDDIDINRKNRRYWHGKLNTRLERKREEVMPSPAEMIEAHKERLELEQMVPDNISMPELVDGVIRGKYKLDPSQLRVLVAWMPHFAPKLSATATVNIDGSFAERLEKCLERSAQSAQLLNGPKTIDHEPLVSATELKRPFQSYRRF